MPSTQKAPPASAPKGGDFVSFIPFAEDGPVILTILDYDFIKNHVFTKEDGTTEVADAVSFYFGAQTDQGPRFIKTWPGKYSIHEKANYAKLYKAASGALPAVSSVPDDILGKGVQTILENEDKVSKKGKAYTKSTIKSVSAVKASLRGSITPIESLLPALKAAMEKKDEPTSNSKSTKPAPGNNTPDEDVPF